MLKKEQRRNRQARPAGALDSRAEGGPGAQPPAPARRGPLPRWSARAAAFTTKGVLARPGCVVPDATTTPTRVPGAWLCAEAGFKSPRVSDRSDRSPNSSQSLGPSARSRALGGTLSFPGSGGVSSTPTRPGACLLSQTYCRGTRQPSILSLRNPHHWLLCVLRAMAWEPSPLFLFPFSYSS